MKTRSRGFTLIELLTVIAIIGILAAILIPTVGKVRDSAKRAKCMSNVRQISIGLVNNANQDRKQMFTSNANAGAWAWDVNHTVIRDLVNQSGRDLLYCPSSNMLTYYQIDQLYNYRPNVSAVTGYILLITGTAQIDPKYLNDKVRSSYTVLNGAVQTEVPASQRFLVVDAVISSGPSFTNVSGGLTNNVSNHMAGEKPAGGHAGYVDAHVKWRPFNTTDYATRQTAGTPAFWF